MSKSTLKSVSSLCLYLLSLFLSSLPSHLRRSLHAEVLRLAQLLGGCPQQAFHRRNLPLLPGGYLEFDLLEGNRGEVGLDDLPVAPRRNPGGAKRSIEKSARCSLLRSAPATAPPLPVQ